MHFNSEAERLVFEHVSIEFEKKGYKFIDPIEVKIPSGKLRYIPDFVAVRGDEYIAIEVKSRRTPSGERSLDRIRQSIEKNTKWTFQVYYAEEMLLQDAISKSSQHTVTNILDEIEGASKRGFVNAAFLLSWGAFESVARNNHSRIFAKPQTPGRIITILAERGEFTADTAQRLRILANRRNSMIHGEFNGALTQEDVQFMIASINELRKN